MRLAAGSPFKSVMMSVLIFEVIVFWLAFAGMIQVSDVSIGQGVLWVGIASGLAVFGIAGLRKGWGYYFGWAAQAAAIALGVLTPWMYAMGIIFALIWIMSFVLGKRLEQPTSDEQA